MEDIIAEGMIKMAKVLMFPQKKTVPGGIQKRLDEIAKEYIEAIEALIILLDIDLSNDSEYLEALEMVQTAFGKSIMKTVNEDEED